MAPRCPGSGVVPDEATPEVCTSAAVRLTGAVGGLLPGRPFALAANGCHLLPAQRAKRGAACFLPSLTSYFNSSLSNTSFLPPSFWEKKGGGPSSSFASLMICQFNLNYRKMGYTDGSNFLHKRICTWLEATQFPQLSPSQKAHTTVISVGLCFPDAVNRDGCTDKGALFCLFPDLWMYLFEPSHRHIKIQSHLANTEQITNTESCFLSTQFPPYCYTLYTAWNGSSNSPPRGRRPWLCAPFPLAQQLLLRTEAGQSRGPQTVPHSGIAWGAGKTTDACLPSCDTYLTGVRGAHWDLESSPSGLNGQQNLGSTSIFRAKRDPTP